MEIIKHKTIEKEEIKHEFYCDECNKFLGQSTEYDDGFYIRYGAIEHRIYARGNYYVLKMHLCDECHKKKMNKVFETLEKVGYTKENRGNKDGKD